MEDPDIVAAGVVVARKGAVLLVHRPKYDDWSFPKGKQDPGEHILATAVREAEEETGVRVVLGRPLDSLCYPVNDGRTKLVHYWAARVAGDADVSSYEPNDEIDEVRWVPIDKALRRLSYDHDRALLEQHRAAPRRTWPLVVLRHGHAFPRREWAGDDRLRPLAADGRAQARLMPPLLSAYGVARAVTSPSKRCTQTVRRATRRLALPVDRDAALSEEGCDDARIGALVDSLLDARYGAVVCTHRPVLPVVLDHLGVGLTAPLAPGEMVVCHHRGRDIVAVERHRP
ncbi:MAG TPA: NUDIX hydrolase [Marmoricola sp.]|nr:NUDIX hydrolase [Marmoricola sp.]